VLEVARFPSALILETNPTKHQQSTMGGGGAPVAGFDAALERRQALMGKSGPGALVKNFKVFRIAMFACIGGILYGYNQGMFSGILAMNSFGRRKFLFGHFDLVTNATQKRMDTLITRPRKAGLPRSWSWARGLEPSCPVSSPRAVLASTES
jgi:hypothetical protein